MSPAANDDETPLPARLAAADARTRLQAVTEILKRRDVAMVEDLLATLAAEKDPRVLATLVKALGVLGKPDHLPTLAEHLDHEDARVRANVVEALIALDTALALPLIMPFLSDPDGRVRANTVIALSRLGEQRVTEVLGKMIRSPQKWMRASAVHALTTLEPARARPLLTQMLEDPEPTIRARVEQVLARLDEPAEAGAEAGPEQATPATIDASGDVLVMPPKPRERASREVARVTGEGPLDIETVIRDRDIEALTSWVHRLGEVEDRFVRSRILSAVGILGERSLAFPLRGALTDPDPRVIANAIRSLEAIGDREADSTIRPMLHSMNPRIRAEAIRYFSQDLDVDLQGPLRDLLASGDIQARLAGLYCLAEMERPDLLPLVEIVRTGSIFEHSWELLRQRADAMDRRDLPQGRAVREALSALGPPDEVRYQLPSPPPAEDPYPRGKPGHQVSEKVVVSSKQWSALMIAGRITATLTDILLFVLPALLVHLGLSRHFGKVPVALTIALIVIPALLFLCRDIPSGPGLGKRLLGFVIEKEPRASSAGFVARQLPVLILPWGLMELKTASRQEQGQRPTDIRFGLRVVLKEYPRFRYIAGLWIGFAVLSLAAWYLYQRPAHHAPEDTFSMAPAARDVHCQAWL